jgi:hypothetical protein
MEEHMSSIEHVDYSTDSWRSALFLRWLDRCDSLFAKLFFAQPFYIVPDARIGMAEKCAVCGAPIDVIFLEKINGTYLRDKKGKKRVVCSACQSSHPVDALRTKLA